MSQPIEIVPCRPEDLGRPIPANPHAVSVCLPTWADNVAYEMADPRVIDRIHCGYPRFFLHPAVVRLFRACETRFAGPGECCFAFPSRRVAERCAEYVRRHKGVQARIDACDTTGTYSLSVPIEARDVMKSYWQHTGQIVSSRWAESLLGESGPPVQAAAEKQTIRERIAGLMSCEPADVWLFPSGMGAIETAFRACQRLRPSAKSIQFGFPYVDSLKLQERCGVGAHFYSRGDAGDLHELAEKAAREPLLGLFCEFPGNPILASPDLRRINELARKHDFPVIVDDTLGALINVDVLPAADAVTCSLTKFFSGGGDVMGGSLVLNSRRPQAGKLRAAFEAEYEDLLFGEDAIVLEQHSRDCVERTARINATAERLCDALRVHPAVARIDYPKFQTPENYRSFLRPQSDSGGGGYGGLFSLLLRDAERNAPIFFDALRIAKGPNLGTNFSLCCPYTILAHFEELDFVEACGVSRWLLRVSVGLEDPEWLIERFQEVLAAIQFF